MQDAEKSSVETAASGLEHSSRQFEALLVVSEAIAQQRDLKALFHAKHHAAAYFGDERAL